MLNKVQQGIKPGELNVILAGEGKGKSIFGEQKVYADGSTGHYTQTCSQCDARFTGHKRDPLCGACESKIPVQQDLPL